MPGFFKNPTSAFTDIAYLLLTSTLLVGGIAKFDKSTWLSFVVPAFLKGYVSGYPQKDQQKVFEAIIESLKNFAFGSKGEHTFKKYNSIFDEQLDTIHFP